MTALYVLIIVMTILMMAIDMQKMIFSPIDRIAKLIKTISGRHLKKKRKKEGTAPYMLSLSKMFEAFELETYFGLKTMNLFLTDLEHAFGISMGKHRQSLWNLEHWFDKFFLLINVTMADLEKPNVTVEELLARFPTFFRHEMAAVHKKVHACMHACIPSSDVRWRRCTRRSPRPSP